MTKISTAVFFSESRRQVKVGKDIAGIPFGGVGRKHRRRLAQTGEGSREREHFLGLHRPDPGARRLGIRRTGKPVTADRVGQKCQTRWYRENKTFVPAENAGEGLFCYQSNRRDLDEREIDDPRAYTGTAGGFGRHGKSHDQPSGPRWKPRRLWG